jgi:DNA mismatch endonuclease (patch repair protein)
MAAIRSRNTKPELVLRRALRASGLAGYRCHHPQLPGKPDIAFTRWRVAVFVDGAFWHGHPDVFRFGRHGEYWDDKIRRTQARDAAQEAALGDAGYVIVRLWDFELGDDLDACMSTIVRVLAQAGSPIARAIAQTQAGTAPSPGRIILP